MDDDHDVDKSLLREEAIAEAQNARAATKKAALKRKKAQRKNLTPAEITKRKTELDTLLSKSAAFADVISTQTANYKKSNAGSPSDADSNGVGPSSAAPNGTASNSMVLGQHELLMANQPEIMIGGEMRDYQLEGLTWMMEICSQGLSGILADEMGLGKTIQCISLIARLREEGMTNGPHLIVAPLSTLSNWVNEFEKWAPEIPVLLYHGNPEERLERFQKHVAANLEKGAPNDKFPVVCTSYEIVIRDFAKLSKIDWELIIIDEGHRMKNMDSKLFRELEQFSSVTRFLITGTPLQNNLKELFSLLHFLLPTLFSNWETFETWFDFDQDILDDQGTVEFLEDNHAQALVQKIHRILRPLLLRRLKADVASHLPKKREYILYAPLSEEQTELYHAINSRNVDTRAYLEKKVIEHLTGTTNSPAMSRESTPGSARLSGALAKATPAKGKLKSRSVSMPIRSSPRKQASPNAFTAMMNGKRAAKPVSPDAVAPVTPSSRPVGRGVKRKETPVSDVPQPKSTKSSKKSTPATSSARSTPAKTPTRSSRGRLLKGKAVYEEADEDKEDEMSDDVFERNLREEYAQKDLQEEEPEMTPEELAASTTLELAKKHIAHKKLGNPLLQLRLVCNSPHNFYSPWSYDETIPVDESIINASGKLMLLDRILPAAFKKGHKVLIFSQFTTQLDILHDYAELRKWPLCRIDGAVKQEDRQQQIDLFNTSKDVNLFILSTRSGGQGINLASADTVILFDSDWNPQQDLQAQDRAHRIGQTRPVVVLRLATKGTVEEELLMSAEGKRRLEKLVIQKGTYKDMVMKKTDGKQALDQETLKHMMLKDGEVYKATSGRQILTDEDLDILLDRSDEAYERAAAGKGDADGFRVIETSTDGVQLASDIAAASSQPPTSSQVPLRSA